MNADMGSTYQALGMIPKEQLIRFNKSGVISPVEGVRVTMTRAEHSSSVRAKDPISGKTMVYPGGEPAGYIVQLENGYKRSTTRVTPACSATWASSTPTTALTWPCCPLAGTSPWARRTRTGPSGII